MNSFLNSSLGKTIQTVVRIVDGLPSKEDRKKGWSKTTLQVSFAIFLYQSNGWCYRHRVVCPVALVKQWAQEIKKYTGGILRVVEHYGPSRTSGSFHLLGISTIFWPILVDPDLLSRAHVVVCWANSSPNSLHLWVDFRLLPITLLHRSTPLGPVTHQTRHLPQKPRRQRLILSRTGNRVTLTARRILAKPWKWPGLRKPQRKRKPRSSMHYSMFSGGELFWVSTFMELTRAEAGGIIRRGA